MDGNPSSSRTDRKIIERNRRNQMKDLYSTLNSLVPHPGKPKVISLPDQLEEAANYIKKLKKSLETMKEKKRNLMRTEKLEEILLGELKSSSSSIVLPQFEINQVGSALKVVLITGSDISDKFNIFVETIRVLHEEGAEIVNTSFSVVDDTVFYTLHGKIDDLRQASGTTARISERVKKFVHEGC